MLQKQNDGTVLHVIVLGSHILLSLTASMTLMFHSCNERKGSKEISVTVSDEYYSYNLAVTCDTKLSGMYFGCTTITPGVHIPLECLSMNTSTI